MGIVVIVNLLGVTELTAKQDQLERFWRGVLQRPASVTDQADMRLRQRQTLGALLFSDTRLSGDKTRSCASCHQPARGYTDGLQKARAVRGRLDTLRNTPTLFGLAAAKSFNWDGSAATLEHQALGPITGPDEMAGQPEVIVARLREDADMVKKFREAFPDTTPTVTQHTIALALASFVRTLAPPQTRFDAWTSGDDDALSQQEKRGFRLFVGQAGCVSCHRGWRFTDDGFHDIGLPERQSTNRIDAGRVGVRAFKTPTLRALNKTAPYMHDGRFTTLDDVVDHYVDGITPRAGLSSFLPREVSLTVPERAALVAFLKTL